MSLTDLLKTLSNDQLRELWRALGFEPGDMPSRKTDRVFDIVDGIKPLGLLDKLFVLVRGFKPTVNLRPFFPLLIAQSCRDVWLNSSTDDEYPLRAVCMKLGGIPCKQLLLTDLGFHTWTNERIYLAEQARVLYAFMEENGRFSDLLNAIAAQSPRLDLSPFRTAPTENTHRTTITPNSRRELVYHNFDVRIRHKNANGRYPIEVGDNPLGMSGAAEQPINPAATYLTKLIAGINPQQKSVSEEKVRELGKYLRELLFPARVGTILFANMNEAAQNGEGLRIRLQVDPPELQKLPWEYCYDDDFGYFALRLDTPFVRYVNRPFKSQPLPVPSPLKVLIVVSEPTDKAKLNVDQELQIISTILGLLENNVQVDILKRAEVARVRRALNKNPHIFHFIGHGEQDGDHAGTLTFEDKFGGSHEVTGEQLMVMLANRGIKTVILNACKTAASGTQNAFGSVATALVHGDIPAVIAMKFSIKDSVALGFTRDLYSSLAAGRPLDTAVTEMRIGAHILGEAYWGIPTLYMQSPDGKIWQYDEQLEQQFRRAIDGDWTIDKS